MTCVLTEEEPLQKLTKSLLFHIKIIKCKTMFHVLASHVLLGHLSMIDFECENKDRCIITDGRQPLTHPLCLTRISYCNFKSNPVKSNKKYSVYIKPMSIGTLVQDQRSVTKTVKVKKQHGHRSEIQQYFTHLSPDLEQ